MMTRHDATEIPPSASNAIDSRESCCLQPYVAIMPHSTMEHSTASPDRRAIVYACICASLRVLARVRARSQSESVPKGLSEGPCFAPAK